MQRNEKDRIYLETDATSDGLTHTVVGDTRSVRLFSMRCKEAQSQLLANQDYAQVVSRHDGSSLCFCVCDGVGSSYKGDFAARFLATRVVRWLSLLPEMPEDMNAFSTSLRACLQQWAGEAQQELKRMSLPRQAPALVREVLEEQREMYGSETVFFGGRVERASWSDTLRLSHPAQALFCWMGNVVGRVHVAPGQVMLVGDQDDDRARWSTLHGPRGPVTSWSIALSTLESIVVYTDGFETSGATLATLSDDGWHAQAQRLLTLPGNDDMTALEVRWRLT